VKLAVQGHEDFHFMVMVIDPFETENIKKTKCVNLWLPFVTVS
jgi:hypothetical protein